MQINCWWVTVHTMCGECMCTVCEQWHYHSLLPVTRHMGCGQCGQKQWPQCSPPAPCPQGTGLVPCTHHWILRYCWILDYSQYVQIHSVASGSIYVLCTQQTVQNSVLLWIRLLPVQNLYSSCMCQKLNVMTICLCVEDKVQPLTHTRTCTQHSTHTHAHTHAHTHTCTHTHSTQTHTQHSTAHTFHAFSADTSQPPRMPQPRTAVEHQQLHNHWLCLLYASQEGKPSVMELLRSSSKMAAPVPSPLWSQSSPGTPPPPAGLVRWALTGWLGGCTSPGQLTPPPGELEWPHTVEESPHQREWEESTAAGGLHQRQRVQNEPLQYIHKQHSDCMHAQGTGIHKLSCTKN